MAFENKSQVAGTVADALGASPNKHSAFRSPSGRFRMASAREEEAWQWQDPTDCTSIVPASQRDRLTLLFGCAEAAGRCYHSRNYTGWVLWDTERRQTVEVARPTMETATSAPSTQLPLLLPLPSPSPSPENKAAQAENKAAQVALKPPRSPPVVYRVFGDISDEFRTYLTVNRIICLDARTAAEAAVQRQTLLAEMEKAADGVLQIATPLGNDLHWWQCVFREATAEEEKKFAYRTAEVSGTVSSGQLSKLESLLGAEQHFKDEWSENWRGWPLWCLRSQSLVEIARPKEDAANGEYSIFGDSPTHSLLHYLRMNQVKVVPKTKETPKSS